jgi:hypothetical protein
MTQQIIAVASPLRISIHDHIVVGKDGMQASRAWGRFSRLDCNHRRFAAQRHENVGSPFHKFGIAIFYRRDLLEGYEDRHIIVCDPMPQLDVFSADDEKQ